MHVSSKHARKCIFSMCNQCHIRLCKLACTVPCTLLCLSGCLIPATGRRKCVVSGPATRASQGFVYVERQGMVPATVSRNALHDT